MNVLEAVTCWNTLVVTSHDVADVIRLRSRAAPPARAAAAHPSPQPMAP